MQLEKKIIELKDCRLSIFSTPDRGCFKLYCIHGGPGLSHRSLLPGILELEQIFDLVFIDTRGDGDSSQPTSGDYSLESYARDLNEIKSQLHPHSEVGILGHSFGGFIAIKALALFPSQFKFGILSNTSMDDSWRKSASLAANQLTDYQDILALHKTVQDNPTDENWKNLTLRYAPLYFPELTRDQATKVMESWAYRAAPYIFASHNIFADLNLETESKKISAPCLVVGSPLDRVVPWSSQQDLAKNLRNSKTVLIDGTGHFPFTTQPKKFLNVVHTWWTNIPKEDV